MDRRIIAVDFQNASALGLVASLIQHFRNSEEYSLVVFKDSSIEFNADGVQTIDFPSSADNMSKRKNFIIEHAEKDGFRGFLHIIEDIVAIDKDPRDYILAVERAMDIFDYSIYFSTVTDPCNYIFKKFNPRLTLDIDDDSIREKLSLPKSVSFTSHSNTCWLVYDFNKLDGHVQKFDGRFSIAMYAIIEYLARRRATKAPGQLYYMNQYLSIADEVGAYHAASISKQIDQQAMRDEDAIFRSMSIDFAPDNNIDVVLDDFYQKMKQKIA